MFTRLWNIGMLGMTAVAVVGNLAAMKETEKELEWMNRRLNLVTDSLMPVADRVPVYVRRTNQADELRKLADDYYTL